MSNGDIMQIKTLAHAHEKIALTRGLLHIVVVVVYCICNDIFAEPCRSAKRVLKILQICLTYGWDLQPKGRGHFQ